MKLLVILLTTIALFTNAITFLAEYDNAAGGFINAVLLGANLFILGKAFEEDDYR